MIPEFPVFKKLELSDKKEVEKFTQKYEPYSDFNFTSMWSWDIKNEMKLSQLNHNLVVMFTDYITGKPFYSFLGENKINETINTILEHSKKEGLDSELRLVPEVSINNIDHKLFTISEDRDHFDYIISVDKLMPHDGTERKLSSRRRLINKFKNEINFEIKLLDLKDKNIQNEINSVFIDWENQIERHESMNVHLHLALKRVFNMEDMGNMLCIGIFVNNKLAGYSINEYQNDGYAVGHFQQANIKTFNGIYALLMHDTAPFLKKAGCSYINLEQDLNIPGLRNWKLSHNPVKFLKKYIIRPVEN